MTVFQALLGFSLAAALLTITPGLDTALVLRTAAVEGPKRGTQAALGICVGLFVWGAAASLGLGALLAVSRTAYDVLKFAGALYVLWLGMRMLLAALRKDTEAETEAPETRGGSWLLRGFLTNMLNPKVGIFYVTFIPLFIPAGVPVVPFAILLTAIHVMETLLWYGLITQALKPLARWLRKGSVTHALDGITGAALLGFGIGLFLEQR
jgi:threonine/homoserine/homoserine lactone efflux protein